MECPIVSICCICYNHESYIKNALDGFVMQKTNFPFNIVISDDCSKDDTRKIIERYKAKYPNLICDISPDKNMGAIQNFLYVQQNATGKYIAICEGDDYWTDPYKLQKQVDFLESHPDFSMCCHGADVLNETSRNIDCACEHMTTREYFPIDAFPTWQIPTASIVYRRNVVESFQIKDADKLTAGDVGLILKCMHVGRVWGFTDHMSVYRMNSGGLTSQRPSMADLIKQCAHHIALMTNFPEIDKDYCNRFIAMVYYTIFRQGYDGVPKVKALWIAFKYKPLYVIQKLLKIKGRKRNDLFYERYRC